MHPNQTPSSSDHGRLMNQSLKANSVPFYEAFNAENPRNMDEVVNIFLEFKRTCLAKPKGYNVSSLKPCFCTCYFSFCATTKLCAF